MKLKFNDMALRVQYNSTVTTDSKALPLIYVIYHLAIMKNEHSCSNVHYLAASYLLPGNSSL
jgi:hypothetical protein